MTRILVVEDDPNLRVVIRLVLEQAGYEMSEAPHGKAALDLLAGGERPDMMLVDSKMPILGGSELIQHVRASPALASIPIAMLTGFSDPHPGADATITKPFEKSLLLEVIERLLLRDADLTAPA